MAIIDPNVTEREVLEKKLEKAGREDFIKEVKNLTPPELEQRLMKLAKYRELIVNTQMNDQKLNDAKELVKTLNSPYKEDLAGNKLLTRYIAVLLDETGNLDNV